MKQKETAAGQAAALAGLLNALTGGTGGDEQDGWEATWDARQSALEAVLGKSGPRVLHAMIPFAFGGFADVLEFPRLPGGVAYVTADMTGGDSGQRPNSLGNFELMICARRTSPTAADFIAGLAGLTRQRALQPGEILDCSTKPASPFDAMLLTEWRTKRRFRFAGKDWGLLLCVGITRQDVLFARAHGSNRLLARLKRAGTFPFSTFRAPQQLPCSLLEELPARLTGRQHKQLTPELLKVLNRSLAAARGKIAACHQEWGLGAHEGWGFSQPTARAQFSMPGGERVRCPAQIVGSWDPADQTWEWAWHNPHVASGLKRDSQLVQRYAVAQRFKLLGKGRLKASEKLAWAFTALAASQGGAPGLFVGDTDDLKVFMTLGKPRGSARSVRRP